jgi:N-acetylmuramoyl-L-alanine amidase
MKIKNHRLEGTNIGFQQTPNYYKPPFKTDTGLPDSIIIHYTAMTTLEGAMRALTTRLPKNNVSAHLLIGKNGEIRQLACFDCRTWHAGTSEYNGRKDYNHYSVGIEIDNAGWLERYPNGTFSRPDLLKIGSKFHEGDVLRIRHFHPQVKYEYWEKYTDPQVKAVFDICQILVDTYNIKEILGHDDISPGRKQDPGPAFPMDELRNRIFGNKPHVIEKPISQQLKSGLVSAKFLNIRAGAGEDFEKVANPLPNKTPVEILEERDGWYKVRTQIEGWVSKSFIAPKE